MTLVPPVWLTADEVQILNREIVARTGEPFQVLNRSALEGAVARPLHAWLYEGETDRVALAIRLLVGIGQSHAFLQGNKRTAFFAGLSFITINQGAYLPPDGEDLARLAERVILRDADEHELLAALRPRVTF